MCHDSASHPMTAWGTGCVHGVITWPRRWATRCRRELRVIGGGRCPVSSPCCKEKSTRHQSKVVKRGELLRLCRWFLLRQYGNEAAGAVLVLCRYCAGSAAQVFLLNKLASINAAAVENKSWWKYAWMPHLYSSAFPSHKVSVVHVWQWLCLKFHGILKIYAHRKWLSLNTTYK